MKIKVSDVSDQNEPITLKCEENIDDHKIELKFNFKGGRKNLIIYGIQSEIFKDINSCEFSNYSLCLLKRENLLENEIYNVEIDEQRNGFFIPVTALESKDHNFAEEDIFWKFAQRAVLKLLDKHNEYTLRIDSNSPLLEQEQYETKLSTILNSDTGLLIIENENNENFDFKEVMASIVSYGFVPQLEIYNIERYCLSRDRRGVIQGKLKLYKLSRDLMDSKDLISNLYDLYKSQTNSVFQFFILYQIIELLISKVQKHEYEQFRAKMLQQLNSSSDLIVQNIREIKKIIDESLSEEKRLALLVEKYALGCINEESTRDLRQACFNYLGVVSDVPLSNEETMKNFHTYFYKVRNTIFHNFRLHNEEGELHLREISDNLVIIMSKILCKYKKPII